jgi:histidinol-phosphate aminotransferase
MNTKLEAPSYITAIAPYQAGKPIAELAREMGLNEQDIVKLASNENPQGMSPKAHAAMLAAAEDLGRYPDANGFALKKALSEKFAVPMDWLTLGNGSNDILELTSQALVQPGDEVIYSQYAFAVYALATQARGGKRW